MLKRWREGEKVIEKGRANIIETGGRETVEEGKRRN